MAIEFDYLSSLDCAYRVWIVLIEFGVYLVLIELDFISRHIEFDYLQHLSSLGFVRLIEFGLSSYDLSS